MNKIEATYVWFDGKILIITWTEHGNKEEDLIKIEIKNTQLVRIRK